MRAAATTSTPPRRSRSCGPPDASRRMRWPRSVKCSPRGSRPMTSTQSRTNTCAITAPTRRRWAIAHVFVRDCVCTSVNEVICHGIPDSTVIEDGDIVNVDITAYFEGMHGDTNFTFYAGEVDETSRLLVERTHEAMMRGIKAVRPGREINVIGRVIEKYAKRFDYGVVRDYSGH